VCYFVRNTFVRINRRRDKPVSRCRKSKQISSQCYYYLILEIENRANLIDYPIGKFWHQTFVTIRSNTLDCSDYWRIGSSDLLRYAVAVELSLSPSLSSFSLSLSSSFFLRSFRGNSGALLKLSLNKQTVA